MPTDVCITQLNSRLESNKEEDEVDEFTPEVSVDVRVQHRVHPMDRILNVAHVRQPRPDAGLGFQVQVLTTL